MKGYHFLQADMTAGSGDEAPWEIGEKRTIADPSKIVLCEYGYHSSPSLWDALPYACGPVACLVEISDPIAVDNEANRRKAVSASRKLITAVNIDLLSNAGSYPGSLTLADSGAALDGYTTTVGDSKALAVQIAQGGVGVVLSFFGGPGSAQVATPTTIAEIVALLQAYGLSA